MSAPNPDDYVGWILGGLLSAVAALWATVKALVTLQDKRNREDIDELKSVLHRRRNEITEVRHELADHRKQLADCVTDREELRIMCARMDERLEKIDQQSTTTNQKLDRIEHHYGEENGGS